jgi:hypothetical protein
MRLAESLFAFIAFYFLFLGLRFMVGAIHDPTVFLGDLSLPLD